MFGPIFLIDPRAGFEMVSPLFRLRDASSARIFVTRHRTRLVGRRSILDIDPIGVSFDTRPYSSIIPVTAVPNLDPKLQRDFATEIVRTLRQRGFDALWAGGCVRDQLLGRRPKDYDIATSAQPDDVRSVFGHRRTLAVGAAFGVCVLRLPPPHHLSLHFCNHRKSLQGAGFSVLLHVFVYFGWGRASGGSDRL